MIIMAKNGETLKEFTERLKERATEKKKPIVGEFNGYLLEITEDKSYEQVEKEYDIQFFKRKPTQKV